MPRVRLPKAPLALSVTAAAAVLATLCWMSAVGRMVGTSARFQQSYFGGSAAAKLAFEDLAQNERQEALAQARRAVRTAPLDPPTTSALGSASLALDRTGQAYAAFAVAGTLGWRDIPTQFYWLTQALSTGDVPLASQRLNALLRLDLDNGAVVSALHIAERTRPGQIALGSLLVQNPPWGNRLLAGTGNLTGAAFAGRLAAIDFAAARGADFNCTAVGTAVARLIAKKRLFDAKHLWVRACDRKGDIYLANDSFETSAGKSTIGPFDWHLQSGAGLYTAIVLAQPPLHGYALKIESSMTVGALAASRLAALRPGQYRMTWETARDDGQPNDDITVLVRCHGSRKLDGREAAIPLGQPNENSQVFSVPAQGCPMQDIEIRFSASLPGRSKAGWIDNLEIKPLSDGSPDAVASKR